MLSLATRLIYASTDNILSIIDCDRTRLEHLSWLFFLYSVFFIWIKVDDRLNGTELSVYYIN